MSKRNQSSNSKKSNCTFKTKQETKRKKRMNDCKERGKKYHNYCYLHIFTQIHICKTNNMS